MTNPYGFDPIKDLGAPTKEESEAEQAMENCAQWRIDKGLPCECGFHTTLREEEEEE